MPDHKISPRYCASPCTRRRAREHRFTSTHADTSQSSNVYHIHGDIHFHNTQKSYATNISNINSNNIVTNTTTKTHNDHSRVMLDSQVRSDPPSSKQGRRRQKKIGSKSSKMAGKRTRHLKTQLKGLHNSVASAIPNTPPKRYVDATTQTEPHAFAIYTDDG
ncbi:hypothetical protein GALMADRAFT_1281057 [Galerina marginata CBS 339.88]|uniref:Uncharacterized protein n=1 Tax=Galerina marginata (strain CBS 339.88) TaxID=685588 RepID=A0A067TGD6_GALM3|nr:hypothetical protein GALMADRAFT_1281057 [Galerina marginata CBS 339.88]